MKMIDIQNISYAYGKTKVLDHFSHVFERSHFTAIMGVNGSGKSTLIRCINGMNKTSSGQIFIKDKLINQMSVADIAQHIAYVPQVHQNLFPATVFDTVLAGRIPYMTWRPKTTDIEIVQDILQEMNLTEMALRDINQLSGGERQKVFIARALAQKTDIILLDEPTSNLDLKHQMEIMSLLQNLATTGKTIIMAIHDINMALKYCNRFCMMKNGMLIASCLSSEIDPQMIKTVYDVDAEIVNINGQKILIS
jgi:iron complex transport system ATP-binding protein